MERVTVIHLVVRVGSSVEMSGRLQRLPLFDDVMKRHQEVIEKHRVVWLGKVGRRLGKTTMRRLDQQRLVQHVPTQVYFVQRVSSHYRAFRGSVIQMSYQFPVGEDRLVPKYYDAEGLTSRIGFWMKVVDLAEVTEDTLDQFQVEKTGSHIGIALRRSQAGLFVVTLLRSGLN